MPLRIGFWADRPFRVPTPPRPSDRQHRWRWWRTAFQWIAVYVLIGLLGAYFVPLTATLLPNAISQYASAAWVWVE
jgi:hypothetical protein